jgi:hypothetical protein
VLPVKIIVDSDGGIAIREVLQTAKIQPGDWVEIIHSSNKITIGAAKCPKVKGTIRTAVGMLKDRTDLAGEMLRIREDEDDR